MRIRLFASAAVLVLAGCDAQQNADALENEQTADVRSRLMDNDSTVCGDKVVQVDTLATAHAEYREYISGGGKPIVFEAISATGMNKDIHEVTCGANVIANAWSVDQSYISPIEYKLRPSLDDDQGYVVEVAPRSIQNTVAMHVFANQQSQATPEPEEATIEEESPSQSEEATPTSADTARQDNVEGDPGVQLWQELNTQCRGSSDPTVTEEACPKRDEQHERLNAAGLCYGKEGEYGAQHKWHRCGPDSIR